MTISDDYPDKVALLEDGWAVRFQGAIEAARWKSKEGAEAQLSLLQQGARKPIPQQCILATFDRSLFDG